MTGILIELSIVLAGLAVTAVLFYRFPTLPAGEDPAADYPSVSVIIPARNEEVNLPLLLSDLSAQTLPIHEVICVDDDSEDSTAQIIETSSARLIALNTKPNGWTGKTWACQSGADAATGELLLFLDADVRLGPKAIHTLLLAYQKVRCTVSIQPYHKTKKMYEQFSMLFNLVQIAANGIALPKPCSPGLYGPIILISRREYEKAGGHGSVKSSIVEDMALGLQLKNAGLPFRLYIGNHDISFRMYAGGLRSLLEGWVKNMAAGAAKTSAPVFIMVFLWIASLISVPLQIAKFAISVNWLWLIIYSAFYIVWVCVLAVLARRIGNFQGWAFIIYPLFMLVFLGITIVSIIKILFRLKVMWKGRAVMTEGRTCK